jgi:hypothetical protein
MDIALSRKYTQGTWTRRKKKTDACGRNKNPGDVRDTSRVLVRAAEAFL